MFLLVRSRSLLPYFQLWLLQKYASLGAVSSWLKITNLETSHGVRCPKFSNTVTETESRLICTGYLHIYIDTS